MVHSHLLKLTKTQMDQKRKRLHQVIEQAAENREVTSKWTLKFPIDIAPPKTYSSASEQEKIVK